MNVCEYLFSFKPNNLETILNEPNERNATKKLEKHS